MSDEELRMSFTEHLGELRDRLIRSAIAVAVCAVLCYMASDYIITLLKWPIQMIESGEFKGFVITPEAPEPNPDLPAGTEPAPDGATPAAPESAPAPAPEPWSIFDIFSSKTKAETPEVADPAELVSAFTKGEPVWVTLNTEESLLMRLKIVGNEIQDIQLRPRGMHASWTVLNPLEPLIVTFKIAGYGGLFLAMPFVLYQLCAFIFPGLHPKERKAAQYLIAGCTVLAFAGVLVAYFGVFPFVLPYLAQFVPADFNVQMRMNETISMIVMGLLGFGIAFQFPMVVLILVYLGVVTPDTLRAYRKMVLIGLAVVSAILTPPDPVSMTLMLVPLYLLYEISIWVSYLVIRGQKNGDK